MSHDQIIIRALESDHDVAEWTRIHNQRPVALGTLRILYESESLWRERFASGVMTRILVAEIDGRVVGGAGFEVRQNRSRHVGSFGMGVDVEYQRRGVGSALMAAIIDLADNWYNLRRLELEVYADNAAAVALYKKFGFEVEGLYRKFAYRDGKFVDALAMARLREDPWYADELVKDDDDDA